MLTLFGPQLPPLPLEEALSSDSDDELPQQCISHEAMTKLNEMRINNQFCDAVIKLQTGEIFSVHKAIISACSDYFRTLFTTALNENKDETFVIGITPSAMELLIKFAYLRDVSGINETNVVNMLMISDYFGVLGMMKFCVDFIIKMLSPENCVIYWLMSRYRCFNRLMEKSRSYILEHFVQVAVVNKDILELNIDDFYGIVSEEMLNVKDEKVVWECVIRWIDYSPEQRKCFLTKLMRACRLGLLSNTYFMQNVKRNRYVENDPECRPIIVEAMQFLCNLETISNYSYETPSIAIPRLPHEVIFAIGGWSEGAPQSVIESYDTRADRWVRIRCEDPTGPRSYHGTAVIGTKIYCIGGFNGTDYFNKCTIFDTAKKIWREIAPMHCRRCYVSVAAVDGFIYALGGYDGQTRQNTGERYCPKTNQWRMIAPMHYQRSDADACALNGKLYITGGFNGQECLNTAEYYSPETNSWTLLPPMLSRRSGVSCIAHRGLLYVIGGFNGLSRMSSGERYDTVQRAWTSIRDMNNPRSNFGLEIIDDMLMAIGGFNGVVTIKHCECYVPETNDWLQATDMSIIRSALTANVVCGLPNIRDYIHKDRHKLIEERLIRHFNLDSSSSSFNFESFDDDSLENESQMHLADLEDSDDDEEF